ncbi:MAG: EAL domain-containing protein [Xanthomonadales bacterium]|nr:EAL domain-containing protein [Xanthomonadales bacterium]
MANGAVLLLVNERGDRRLLWELLDGQEFEAIYAAKDVAQARSVLAQDGAIELIVLELSEDDAEVRAFCAELAHDPRTAATPVLAVSAVEPGKHWPQAAPANVRGWLHSPVDSADALARIQMAMAPTEPTTALVQAEPGAADEDYRFAFDASLDELLVSDPESGQVLDANPTFLRQSGFSLAQVRTQTIDQLDLTHRGDARRELMQLAQRQGSVRTRQMTPRADGRRVAVEAVSCPVRVGGRLCLLTALRPIPPDAVGRPFGEFLDMLWSQRGSDGLAKSLTQRLIEWAKFDFLHLVAQRAETGEDGDLVVSFQRPGLPPVIGEHLRNAALRKVVNGDAFAVHADAWKALGGEAIANSYRFESLIGIPLRDERQVVVGGMVCAGRQVIAEDSGLVQAARSVVARLSIELEIERAHELGRAKGLQDSLTGLPNRLLFNDRLETTIKEAHRTGECFAVLFVDLDRFKTVNDSLGHGVGDELLIAVSKRLRACVRGSDTVARYAGDEFTLILRHIVQRDDVLRIADKICRVLETPLTLGDGRELHITSSIGISFYPDDATTAEKMLKHADIAMYNVKGMGRNSFQAYVAVPEESHQQRLSLETKLRVAERNNELRAYYQPQVNAVTEDIIGMEALIRWEHPELGMISPGFFIPLAEDNGLIVPIGEWMLRTACADTKRWHDKFGVPLRISVNLSALQLRQPNLVEVVQRVVTETGLDPNHLELEVTESINVKTIPNLIETLQGLRDMGCSIAIDDFGTGQSSLDYIKRFPADRIKIDQTFVRNIGVDPDDEAIVRATINMAQHLNRGVIAEGVEYEEHLNFLREHGCEELQGYLFCRPLPASSFENLMAERQRLIEGGPVEAAELT